MIGYFGTPLTLQSGHGPFSATARAHEATLNPNQILGDSSPLHVTQKGTGAIHIPRLYSGVNLFLES
jgi:hypothetical protein